MNKSAFTRLLIIFLVFPKVLYADVLSDFEKFSSQMNSAANTQKDEFDSYKKQLENGFLAYKNTYKEEFERYKNNITQQWGEFYSSSNTLWVSYAEKGETRRSVDFKNGEVILDFLINEDTENSAVRQRIDQQILNLLNSTEADAFKSDELAQNVEKQLVDLTPLLMRDTPSDRRLFELNDLNSLVFHSNGFFNVSSKQSNRVTKERRKARIPGKNIIRAKFNIPDTILKKAMRFDSAVTEAAIKEQLSPALIFAIMETESSFNPMAKSHIPAYGLMQIVPHSAGKDATAYLFGKAKILAPSYLFSSDNNIRIGSAYLHVIYYKYLTRIKDPLSRLYCAIAAYNTGTGNVAKAFVKIKNFRVASKSINRLSSDEVYEILKTKLPYKETRHYLQRVSKRMKNYL